LNYIDIHTHSFYQEPETTLVVNVFPHELEKLQSEAFFSVGLHPWHIREGELESAVEQVRSSVADPRVIAIGETGLDKVVGIPYNIQRLAFEKQLDLAAFATKPVVIHCVRSYSEMLAYRKKSDQSIPWIFHWFNSDGQTASELIRKNCYLSFGPILFNEQSRAFRLFHKLPAERIFFETDDAGYSIREVYERGAQIRNIQVEDLKVQIMDNFARCFKIFRDGKLAEQD
jgi:TatD DNase family protein